MKPSPQFQAMIASLLMNKQSSITQNDVIKHRNSDTMFYAVNTINMKHASVTSQTQPFSEQIMIEIEKGIVRIGTDNSVKEYKKVTDPQLTNVQGRNLVYWKVQNGFQTFTIVKLLSPDGFVQIKLISPDEIFQTVYTVCELPGHMMPKV